MAREGDEETAKGEEEKVVSNGQPKEEVVQMEEKPAEAEENQTASLSKMMRTVHVSARTWLVD